MFWNHGNFRAVTFRLDPLFLLVKSPFPLESHMRSTPHFCWNPIFSGEISCSFRVIGDISISAGDISNSWWVNHIFLLVQSPIFAEHIFLPGTSLGKVRLPTILAPSPSREAFIRARSSMMPRIWVAAPTTCAQQPTDGIRWTGLLSKYTQIMGQHGDQKVRWRCFPFFVICLIFRAII